MLKVTTSVTHSYEGQELLEFIDKSEQGSKTK